MEQEFFDIPTKAPLVIASILGLIAGSIATTIYIHSRTPSGFLNTSIMPDARGIVGNVTCSIDREGDGVASGGIYVIGHGVLKISATFFQKGLPAGGVPATAYSYFDSSDPSVDPVAGGSDVFGFSVVVPQEIMGFSYITNPTSCTVAIVPDFQA